MPPSDLIGKPCPDVDIEFVDGTKTKLSEIIANGKPTVVDFYTS